MPSLLALPLELQEMIVQLLSPRSQSALGRTCKHFQTVCTPTISRERPFRTGLLTNAGSFEFNNITIWTLLDQILANPLVGHHIEHLEKAWLDDEAEYRPRKVARYLADAKTYPLLREAAAMKSFYQDRYTLGTYATFRDRDFILAMMIVKCPNLMTLSIDVEDYGLLLLLFRNIVQKYVNYTEKPSTAYSWPPSLPLQHLTKIELYIPNDYMDPEYIYLCAQLPAIRYIYAEHANDVLNENRASPPQRPRVPWSKTPALSSPLEELSLYHCYIGNEPESTTTNLTQSIFRLFTNLQRFKLVNGGEFNPAELSESRKIFDSLLKYTSHSLQTLEFIYDGREEDENFEPQDLAFQMRQFQKLTSITMTMDFLAPMMRPYPNPVVLPRSSRFSTLPPENDVHARVSLAARLPSVLEKLIVRDFLSAEHGAWFEDMFRHDMAQVPALMELGFTLPWRFRDEKDFKDELVEWVEEMRLLCAGTGVQVGIPGNAYGEEG